MTVAHDPAPLTGYRFNLDCPRCGGRLHHRAEGRPTGLTTRAIAYCPPCRDEWMIEVTIRSAHVARQAETNAHRERHMATR